MDKEYNEYLWSPKQPRVYDISPLRISGTPMSEEDAAMSLRAENLQQSLQQNPIFKSTKQWAAQQKQREKEIAASKKWLELHPEDDNDDPYTIFERGKHQAIVDGKDPSYYEKMIDDGKQFTKGALSVLSLPYLSVAAAGAYGYGASLGARGLFAAQGIHGLANENGVRKTANLIKSGDYGKAALSGAGDVLNAAMVLPGAKFLGKVAKYGLKPTVVENMLEQNIRYAPQIGGRLVVNQDYFKDPTKFYRIGATPEKFSIEYAGENIVSGSAKDLGKVTPADTFRRTVTKNSRIQPGKGANEGYWVLSPEQSNTKTTDLIQKVNSSHGGETQASAGTLWKGGLNSDSRFPTVIFEGTMPETVRASWNSTLGKSIGRSTFVRQPSENLPIGTRLGFKTGEMPIHSTSSFVETSPGSGKFFYNGEIIPENRIFSPQQFSKSNGKTYLGLLERPSKLSEAEWLDVPKDLSPNISRSLGFSSTTGEELFMPNEILGEFVSGKNQAAKFFQQPVVQNSYAHNKELANRLGINIANRPENISEIVGAPIKLSPYIQNPGNELANIAQSYLGDPSATLSIAWTPFSKRVAKLTGIHEGLHRGHYAQVIKPAPTITKNYYETTMRPEATFWNWKINKLLKPEYQNGYLGGPFDGEAGVNLIEMGRDMGVKLGAKYPGDEVFMNMINNYNGHKSFLIPHLDLDTRAGRRHVWDAMTGQYFKQGGILKRVESGKSEIHIKPENRDKLTRLKKRTGKSESELWKEGNPAVRKMITFARNSRKWKHK